MIKLVLVLVLVGIFALVAETALAGGVEGRALRPADIAGRWTGASYSAIRSGTLTLDIVACGAGWCGVMVGAGEACGSIALKLGAGQAVKDDARFQGSLELAPGTEPYTVHATIFAPEEGKPLAMQLTGDTGGEYRAFRRSFPFESTLFRVEDAACHAPGTVSSLR